MFERNLQQLCPPHCALCGLYGRLRDSQEYTADELEDLARQQLEEEEAELLV
eukprot:COSAG03_NODE_17916_length_365_cov_1.541353_1_plen_51_part_01